MTSPSSGGHSGAPFSLCSTGRGSCVSQPRPGGSLRPQPAWPRGQRRDWPRPRGGQGQSCQGRVCALSPWAAGLHAETWMPLAPVAGLPLLQGSLCGQLSQSAVSASLKGSERLPEEKARRFLEEDLSRPATQPRPCPVPRRREEAPFRGSHLGTEDRAWPELHALHTRHRTPKGPAEAPQSPVLRPPCRWPQVNKGMRVKAQQITSRPTGREVRRHQAASTEVAALHLAGTPSGWTDGGCQSRCRGCRPG